MDADHVVENTDLQPLSMP